MAGQLRVDEITDEAGTGSPSFPQKITPSSLGTGTPTAANFLRGDGAWEAVPPATVEILNTQTFNTSGTWTKPTGFDDDDTVVVVCIGGGGSGAIDSRASSSVGAAGGGASACAIIGIRYADAPSTTNAVVGAGGAAVTGSGVFAMGNRGGISYFGDNQNDSLVMASGFAGLSVYTPNMDFTRSFVYAKLGTTTTPLSGLTLPAVTSQQYIYKTFLDYGSYGRQVNSSATEFVDPSVGLVGGGGGVANSSTTYRTQVQQGHKGTVFGEGGDAGAGANGSNGTAPGGGGGGARRFSTSTTSGAGANGAIIVYICRGRIYPPNVFGITG